MIVIAPNNEYSRKFYRDVKHDRKHRVNKRKTFSVRFLEVTPSKRKFPIGNLTVRNRKAILQIQPSQLQKIFNSQGFHLLMRRMARSIDTMMARIQAGS